jgi:hypothetical protein
MNSMSWQIPTVLLMAVASPAIAGTIVTIALLYAPGSVSAHVHVGVSGFPGALLAMLPLAYGLGGIPATIGAILYCGVLTAVPIWKSKLLWRASLSFFCGAGAAAGWCHYVLGFELLTCSIAGGIPAFLLALRLPNRATL